MWSRMPADGKTRNPEQGEAILATPPMGSVAPEVATQITGRPACTFAWSRHQGCRPLSIEDALPLYLPMHETAANRHARPWTIATGPTRACFRHVNRLLGDFDLALDATRDAEVPGRGAILKR